MKKIIILILILKTSIMLPCKCNYFNFRQECKYATAIFVGRVINIKQLEKDTQNLILTEVMVVVEHIWKGSVKDTLVFIYTNRMCNYNPFMSDQRHVVYSKNNHVSFCGRTRTIEKNTDVYKLNFKYRYKRYKRPSRTVRTLAKCT